LELICTNRIQESERNIPYIIKNIHDDLYFRPGELAVILYLKKDKTTQGSNPF
jgi:hypothetical protein